MVGRISESLQRDLKPVEGRMSFKARMKSKYIPFIMESELDLLAQTDPEHWRGLRAIFTGKDPEALNGITTQMRQFFEEAYRTIAAQVPGMPQSLEESWSECKEGIDFGMQFLVGYYENRVDLPTMTPKAPVAEDPAQLAADVLRSLGIRTLPDQPTS